MTIFYTTTNSDMSEREKRNADRARKIAAQGMVLLENNGVLPLRNKKKLALFGNGARRTVKGGVGSGDVNSRFVINVEQGLEAAGFQIVSKTWLDEYDRITDEAQSAYYSALNKKIEEKGSMAILDMFNHPFREPAVIPVTETENVENADTALFIISRNSGEGKDRAPVAGEYELYEEEKESIRTLRKIFDYVIVALNVGGVIDTKFLREESGIDALLLMGQAGNIGGYALADVLTGAVTPGGHLTDTWAENYMDYPSAETFSHMNGNLDDEFYREGIYVGYRYFDSFNITPAYPFGYGLSYTKFDVRTVNASVSGNLILLDVCVKNTGNTYSGSEVIQIYFSAPEGKIEKPYQELAAYAKTKELEPGEEELVKICFPVERMASYDEERASFVLEAGTYYIRVGVHSRATRVVAAAFLEKEVITERLSNRMASDSAFEMFSSEGVTSYSYENEEQEKQDAVSLSISPQEIEVYTAAYRETPLPLEMPVTKKVLKADDVRNGDASVEELVAQLTVEEMAQLCVGTARGEAGEDSVIGSASRTCPGAAGDTTSILSESRDIRNIILADGPAGLRLTTAYAVDKDGKIIQKQENQFLSGIEIPGMALDTSNLTEGFRICYQYCTAIPIATMLAQTWDLKMIEEAGDIVGEEMEEMGVTLWLAPGMNIHRNPLCGRNFEYYSEDPLVSGLCAAADTRGVQKHSGIGTTIKHFALNNQEDNRMHTNVHVSERAAREIYLKGFEIAVKESHPMAIMTSYNLINGVHSANHYDLLTAIARDEWGFQGMIMTDWGTTGSIEMEPEKTFKYGTSSAAGCIKAGNDLIMPGSQEDVDEIIRSVKEKTSPYALTVGELQSCAVRILSVILQSSVYKK